MSLSIGDLSIHETYSTATKLSDILAYLDKREKTAVPFFTHNEEDLCMLMEPLNPNKKPLTVWTDYNTGWSMYPGDQPVAVSPLEKRVQPILKSKVEDLLQYLQNGGKLSIMLRTPSGGLWRITPLRPQDELKTTRQQALSQAAQGNMAASARQTAVAATLAMAQLRAPGDNHNQGEQAGSGSGTKQKRVHNRKRQRSPREEAEESKAERRARKKEKKRKRAAQAQAKDDAPARVSAPQAPTPSAQGESPKSATIDLANVASPTLDERDPEADPNPHSVILKLRNTIIEGQRTYLFRDAKGRKCVATVSNLEPWKDEAFDVDTVIELLTPHASQQPAA